MTVSVLDCALLSDGASTVGGWPAEIQPDNWDKVGDDDFKAGARHAPCLPNGRGGRDGEGGDRWFSIVGQEA